MPCNLFYFKKPNNYGDVMSPWLLDMLGIKYRIVKKQFANTLIIGSIANHARLGTRLFGTGFIRRNDVINRMARYIWLRGPISRQMVLKVGIKVPELYGDCALLLPDFIKSENKEYDVGYIPHYVDYDYLKDDVFKINLIEGSIEEITKEITKCRKIISSSLHGIIVAHAYGIPAAWIKLSDNLSGDDMKFHDHYESVGLKAICSTIDNPIFQVPTQIKTDHMIPLLKEHLL